MTLFEVYLSEGTDPTQLLSAEVLSETNAQIMSAQQAEQVGFGGLPPPALSAPRVFVAVVARDAAFVQRRLEAHVGVVSFKVHHLDS